MAESFYPKAPEGNQENVSEAEKLQLGRDFIYHMENGSPVMTGDGVDPDSYFPESDRPAGTPLEEPHIRSLGLAGRDWPVTGKEVYNEVVAERKALQAINPADFGTQAEFKAALDAIIKYGDSTAWYNALLTKHGVSKWSDLKGKLTVAEL